MRVIKYSACSAQLPEVQLFNTHSRLRGRSGKTGPGGLDSDTPDTTTASGVQRRHFESVGNVKRFPIFPSSPLRRTLRLCDSPANCTAPNQDSQHKEDWTRWNDYGIGLSCRRFESRRRGLRENHAGDPQNPTLDNIGRVWCKRDTAGARRVLENPWRSTALGGRISFTRAPQGGCDYDALSLTCNRARAVPARRVCATTGRVLFLERRYADA